MADWYASTAAYAGYTAFQINHAYIIGDLIVPTAPAAKSKWVLRCTTAGTSAGVEPTWATANNATTVSNTATFTNVTGQSTYFWTAAAGDLASLTATSGRAAVGDRVFISSDHSETQSTSTAYGNVTSASYGVLQFLCVNRAGSTPPVAADLTTGATLTFSATGTSCTIYNIVGVYWHGVSFIHTGGTTSSFVLGSAAATGFKSIYLKSCSLYLNNASTSSVIQTNGMVHFNNTTVQFGNASQKISSAGTLNWFNTASALLGTMPTNLFNQLASLTAFINCRGVDLSATTNTLVLNAEAGPKVMLESCKIASGVTRFSRTSQSDSGDEVMLSNCYDGTNIISEYYTAAGTVSTEFTIILPNGAADDVGAYSHKMATTANLDKFVLPLSSFWMDSNYTNLGISRTATVEIITNGVTALNNDEIALYLEYEGTAGSSLASLADSFITTPLTTPSAVTTSTASWNTVATYASLNSSDSLNCSVSGLTVTGSGNGGVRTFESYSSGQYYYEMTATTINGNDCGLGMSIGSASLASLVSNGTNGAIAFNFASGTIYINGSAQGTTLGAWSNGDVICVALDVTNKKIWFRKNAGNWDNIGGDNPATNTGGYSLSALAYPYYGLVTCSSSGVLTANFGATSFAQAVPSGFTSGLPSSQQKQKLQVAFTAQVFGRLRGQVRLGKASTIVYVNPLITVT